MDISDIKNEVSAFINDLYNNLKEELYLCGDLKEVNETLDEEYVHISDYRKSLQSNLLIRSKNELMGKDKMNFIEDTMGDIHIPHMEIDEGKLYVKEEYEPIISEEKSNEKKRTKAVIVIAAILIGFSCGVILKRNIMDGIIMGFIGAAFGVSVYEMYFAGDNKNYEKMIRKDRIMNKRLDKEYLNALVEERKGNIESSLINYIDDFNSPLEEKI